MGLPNWNSLRLRRKLRIPQHRAVLLQRKHHDRAGVVHFDAAQLFINLQHLYRAGRLALGQDARSLLRLPAQIPGIRTFSNTHFLLNVVMPAKTILGKAIGGGT